MSAEAWEDPLRTTRKHLDQLSADKGENDENIARLEDEKDLVLRALGGALARNVPRATRTGKGTHRMTAPAALAADAAFLAQLRCHGLAAGAAGVDGSGGRLSMEIVPKAPVKSGYVAARHARAAAGARPTIGQSNAICVLESSVWVRRAAGRYLEGSHPSIGASYTQNK